MYYIKYMPYKSFKNASRNRREIITAKEFGFKTIVFSNDRDNSSVQLEKWELENDGTIPMPYRASTINKIITIARNRLVVYRKTRKLPNGIWSCHDLHSLMIAYFSTRIKKEKPILIYDSHEFELGRNKKRNIVQRHLIKIQEKHLINKCAFSVMVNDSIADEVQKTYRLKNRPIVVRSTPDYWVLDESECEKIRSQFLHEFEIREK